MKFAKKILICFFSVSTIIFNSIFAMYSKSNIPKFSDLLTIEEQINLVKTCIYSPSTREIPATALVLLKRFIKQEHAIPEITSIAINLINNTDSNLQFMATVLFDKLIQKGHAIMEALLAAINLINNQPLDSCRNACCLVISLVKNLQAIEAQHIEIIKTKAIEIATSLYEMEFFDQAIELFIVLSNKGCAIDEVRKILEEVYFYHPYKHQYSVKYKYIGKIQPSKIKRLFKSYQTMLNLF